MPMRHLVPVLSSVLLLACGDKDPDDTGGGDDTGGAVAGLEHGTLSLCLGTEDPDQSYEHGNETWDVEGTVISDMDISDVGLNDSWANLVGCWGAVDRGLFLEDASGNTWSLGYGVVDADQVALTPALGVTAGDTVSLRFRAELSFGASMAAVLRDADGGLLAAMDDGGWGNVYDPADVPELAVSMDGTPVGEVDTGCGLTRAYTTTFETDADEVSLLQLEQGSVEVDDWDLKVLSVGAWDYVQVECTDVGGAFEWMAWR